MAIFLESHKDRFEGRQSECCFDVQMVRCHETEEEYINEKYKSDLFHFISGIVSIDTISMLRYI